MTEKLRKYAINMFTLILENLKDGKHKQMFQSINYFICVRMITVVNKLSYTEANYYITSEGERTVKIHMTDFAIEQGIDTTRENGWWEYDKREPRIEFLEKYIKHLKEDKG